MDAFFASVEIRRRPELRGRPVIVGGTGPRGVVSSASYEARRYGVHSAMPGSRARALCPVAVFLPPDFAAYAAASRSVMAIFRDVTPLVEPLSLDEAFLDVSGAVRLLGNPARIAASIRARVAAELGLTCSVGVAPTKFMAKIASTRAKPDGLVVVPVDRVLDYLWPLPVEALWGVGEQTAQTLHRLGLVTVADVAAAPYGMLRAALGEASARHLSELAAGRDDRAVNPAQVEKSIGAETTFDTDTVDTELIRRTMLGLAAKVGARMRRSGQVGRTVALKLRLADFRTLSRSRTLVVPTDVTQEIFDTAWSLFSTLQPGRYVRLIGVRVEGLASAAGAVRQPVLGAAERGWHEADLAGDAITARFGADALRRATLLDDRDGGPGDRDGGPGDRNGGPAAGTPGSSQGATGDV